VSDRPACLVRLRLTPYLSTGFRLLLDKQKGCDEETDHRPPGAARRGEPRNRALLRAPGAAAKPPRTEAGYRQFSPDVAQRLRFIKRAQELGFSLEEVRELLAIRVEAGNCADVRARAQAKIADIEEKMKTLAAMKSTLRGLVDRCEQSASTSECVILASLEDSK
jgi:MerR family copper efflux transcriptional regulator